MLKSLRHIFMTMRRRFKQAMDLHSWTVEYPFVVRSLPVMSHTTLKNNFLECTGCKICSDGCPVHAIQIEGYEYSAQMRRPLTSAGVPFDREVENFKIDYSKCIFCGICVEKCPTDSLSFTRSFARPEEQEATLTVDLVHIPRSMRRGQNVERSHES
jgi:formate hydrogenlyase subunit 6/NADH:ubiquinone oxidoreductase subunit I